MDGQNYNNQNEQNNNYQDYTNNQQYSYQPQQQQPPKQSNVLAIVGMIFGIISIPAGCCGWYSLILGIPGLVCSILSRKQGKSGMSVAGIVCSVIGIIIGVLMTVLAYLMIALVASDPEFQQIFEMYGM